MKFITKLFTAMAFLIAGAAIADPSGTLRESHDLGFGENSSLDPISKGRVFQMTDKLMDRLVRPGLDGSPSADLAESWSANADATVWTFNIRKGVKFHDGSNLDADDVLYSFTRVLDPDIASPARSAVKMIDSMKKTGSHTVEFTLNTPFADLPLTLMDYRLRILPEGSGDSIARTGIGTGPFKLEKLDFQGTTVLAANEDYWAGAPGVAKIEIIAIPEGQARLQAFMGGQIDILFRITEQQKTMLEGSDRYNVAQIPTGNWRGLIFRTDVEPFNDPRVRKAMRLVADREALVQLVQGGAGNVACDSPVAPNDQYRADISCPQDIEQAKALLAEAGFADGIEVNVHVATLEPTWPTLGIAYQAQAAEAGIRVNVVQTPSDGYWNRIWMKKDVAATRWKERPADQALHEIYLSTAKWNESFYKDVDFDELLASARRELDFEKRKALYVQAQEHLFENAGTLIPYTVSMNIGSSSRVQNFDAAKEEAVRWHLVTVD
jgi:peptide/nickel transport system substrate-binding protein